MALDASRRIPGQLRDDGDGGRIAEDLFYEHSARIYAYCRTQLDSREDAEDAVQATFLTAYRGLTAGFRPRVPVAWLLWIAANVCRKRHRSRFRLRRREWLGDPDALEETLPAAENGHEELFGLSHALKSLPERQRRALVRREWQGLSYDEIAAELEVSHSAIETLLFRARRSLKAALERPRDGRTHRRHWSLDLGSLALGLKSLVAGSTAGKVAVGVAVVATATTAAVTPLQWGLDRAPSPANAGSPEGEVSARPFASEAATAPWSQPARERAAVKALQSPQGRRGAPASRPRRNGTPPASPRAGARASSPSPSASDGRPHDPSAAAAGPAKSDAAPVLPPVQAPAEQAQDKEPSVKAKGGKNEPKKVKAKKEKSKAEKGKAEATQKGAEQKPVVSGGGRAQVAENLVGDGTK